MWYHFKFALLSSGIQLKYHFTYCCLTSDRSFKKPLINVSPTLVTFNTRWVNLFPQRSFNVLLLTLDKLSKNYVLETFTQRKN